MEQRIEPAEVLRARYDPVAALQRLAREAEQTAALVRALRGVRRYELPDFMKAQEP